MSIRDLTYEASPGGAREALAALLKLLSRVLDALAARVAITAAPRPVTEPVIEFYGDAAAPEGALYVDGQLVGTVLGVNRL